MAPHEEEEGGINHTQTIIQCSGVVFVQLHGAVYFILKLHVILDVPGKVLYFLQAIKPTYCTA